MLVKIIFNVTNLSELQSDSLKCLGFNNHESRHIWNKLYEVDNLIDSNKILISILDELEIEIKFLTLEIINSSLSNEKSIFKDNLYLTYCI